MEGKDLKLHYNIAEVAEMFGVAPTLLRYWEKEFPAQIHPRKSGRNVRTYTQADIDQIRLVYNLVKVRGMKLAAAREALRKNHSGEAQTAEVLERLQAVRDELQEIKRNLSTLG